jgi:hypothetical protein
MRNGNQSRTASKCCGSWLYKIKEVVNMQTEVAGIIKTGVAW